MEQIEPSVKPLGWSLSRVKPLGWSLSRVKHMNGILAVYKPRGFTSSDIVKVVKNVIIQYYKNQGIRINRTVIKKIKVGHGGTLDKDAEGVLVIGINKGTKMLQDQLKGDKVYLATGILGKETDTLDGTGEIIKTCEYDHITKDKLEETIKKFIGEIDQVPPVYSALKKKGKRVSDLIREGVDVKMEPRKVNIYNIDLIDFDLPEFKIRASVGGGTYIRSLIRDIGTSLNSCAYMSHLVREKQGSFTIKDALQVNELNIDKIIEKLNH